jgi:acyl-CoA thioesterase FadM
MRLRRERGWLPMMGGLQAAYLREIRLWRRFKIVSSFAAWTGTQIIGQHRFILDDGTPAATILTTAGIYDRANRKFVPLEEVVSVLGYPTRSPPVSESEQSFLATHALLRNEARVSASAAK